MKNFKQEKCKENRNYLRYLETDTFIESPATTVANTIKNKLFIKNKTEILTADVSKIFYEVRLANKAGFIYINISKDHLITAKVSYKKTKEIKTRDMAEVVSLINEVLFT